MDISKSMLDVAVEREVEGDLVLGDLGEGLPFRAGAFDGAISISALQVTNFSLLIVKMNKAASSAVVSNWLSHDRSIPDSNLDGHRYLKEVSITLRDTFPCIVLPIKTLSKQCYANLLRNASKPKLWTCFSYFSTFRSKEAFSHG